jgi:glycosyltransferase involved in cell wall biosynthesis
MNVIIEARALSATSGGVKSYTHELITHLLALRSQDSFEVIYGSENITGLFPSVKETVLPLSSELLLPYWLSARVGQYVKMQKPTVVHYTKAAIPLRSTGIPTVVTIYDIIPEFLPETQSFLRRMYWPAVLRHASNHADHIITISEQSKKDIIQQYQISEDKITVTPLAVNASHFYPRPKSNTAKPYILFVGTRDQRKNISSLIRSFAALSKEIPHQLVIAGKSAHKNDESKQIVQELSIQNRVEFREYIPYEDLPQLYSDADLFVWPSVYEGWGFPPQEAMACGTPVIVSDGGSLPEVVGDAGIVVPFSTSNLHMRMNDTSFIELLTARMREVLGDTALAEKLRSRGLLQSKKFSWQGVAEKTRDVYRHISDL